MANIKPCMNIVRFCTLFFKGDFKSTYQIAHLLPLKISTLNNFDLQ